MKAIALKPVPVMPSNFSNEEALKHVRHYYPNPGPVLEDFIKRFEELLDGTPDQDELEEKAGKLDDLQATDHEVRCPNCGSELEIQLELGT